MSKDELIVRLQQAIVDLEDEEVSTLIQEGVDAGMAPMEMIAAALSPGLNIVGEQVQGHERSVSDLVIASEIMNGALRVLLPVIEACGQPTGDTMIIGAVEGSRQNFQGRQIVAATFIGAGYRVVDIGEDVPPSEFVKAVREHKATVVGVSALSSLKLQCGALNQALIAAGIRDDVIHIVGGWGVTQEWCDSVGADAFGENAADALAKVRAISRGDIPKRRFCL